MTVYAIALLNIADRERYGAYQQGFLEIFSRYSGKLLAVDEAPTVKEGDWPYTRTVLIEFPDAEAFDASMRCTLLFRVICAASRNV